MGVGVNAMAESWQVGCEHVGVGVVVTGLGMDVNSGWDGRRGKCYGRVLTRWL